MIGRIIPIIDNLTGRGRDDRGINLVINKGIAMHIKYPTIEKFLDIRELVEDKVTDFVWDTVHDAVFELEVNNG